MVSISRIKVCSDGTILELMKCKECGTEYWTNKPKEDLSRNYCVDHKSRTEQEEKTRLLSRLLGRNKTETPKVYEIANRPCNRCGGLITWEVKVDGDKPTHVNESGHIQGDGRCHRNSLSLQTIQSMTQNRTRPRLRINQDKLNEYKWYIFGFAGIIAIIDLIIIFGIYPVDGPYLDLYTTIFFQAIFKIIGIAGIVSGLIVLFFSVLKLVVEKEKTEKKIYGRYLILAIVLVIIGLLFVSTPTTSFNINPEFVSFYYTKISNITY